MFLSTIHSAKGMEFPHVFILDSDWRVPVDRSRAEEERRVMYVGMTRDRETLRLMKIPSRANPFLKELRTSAVLPLTYRGESLSTDSVNKSYELIGLNEIFMDYAGSFPETHRIHNHLAELGPGSPVFFFHNRDRIEVHDGNELCIAKLSNEGSKLWGTRLDRVKEIRVVAVLQRNRDDPEEAYQANIRSENWELPVLEVISN